MRRLINSEVIWYFFIRNQYVPIDNVRNLTQGVLWPFCHTISASLGVQQRLHFIGQRCWTCSLYTSCFFFACLAGKCSGFFRKWLKELKVCNDPSGRFGASLRCHVYTYTCSTYTWKWIWLSVVHTPISSRNKLCCEYVRLHLDFCVRFPCSIKIYSLSLDLAMNLSNSVTPPTFLA